MACISFTSIITSIVITVLTAIGGLFCSPFYSDIKTTVEAVLNPHSLDDDSNTLNELLNDVKAMKCSEVMNKWIDEANEIIHKINQLRLQQSGSSNHNNGDHQSSCVCGDAWSRCNLHRKIKKMIAQGEINKRFPLGREPVEHIRDVPNIEDGTTAGRNLKRVTDMLNDDNVWCIVVWGPGGVGKTTLVMALNNKLMKSDSPFSLVRLIKLKGSDEYSDVQEAIAKRLGLNFEEGIEDQIHNTLQKENFLLILDNVWKSIDLTSIGIPERQTGSKIILTTRFQKVCIKMDAKEVEMGYLTEGEAWQLFLEKAGEVVTDKKIKPLAKEICDECGYLPLALVVVGSAMKGEANINEWQNSLNKLRNSVPIDVDVEAKVYNPLKLSYDLLDDTLKSCFLYCSLYPENYSVEIYELVQCWLTENLIDEQLYYSDAYSVGLSLIKKLNQSCLLEQGFGEDSQPKTVKMHDVVRDVARWIGKCTKKSVVFSGYGKCWSPIVTLPDNVNNFQWISFVDNREIILPEYERDYSSVTTLLLRGTRYLNVPTEFLNGFRAVKVLKMERVQLFSSSLLQLEELHALILRNCYGIEEVPTTKKLKILDLSHSYYLQNLPRGIKDLSYLKVLNLSYVSHLKRIGVDTIHNLNSLEVLDMSSSGYSWPVRKSGESESATLEDLSRLKLLKEVYLDLAEADGTYEECMWMERLKRFRFSYNRPASRRYEGRIFVISMEDKYTKLGSFILYADSLVLHHIENVNKLFANFSLIDQSNSKLKSLEICNSAFDPRSTATAPKYSVLLNVEELYLRGNKSVRSFSDVTNALGTTFF